MTERSDVDDRVQECEVGDQRQDHQECAIGYQTGSLERMASAAVGYCGNPFD